MYICENKGVARAAQDGRVEPQNFLRLLFDL